MNRVVYLHGFASSPLSTKARFFGERFASLGIPMVVPDLAEGDFEHLTISGQLRVIEKACGGQPVTLMGSSLGGYLAALYAARNPKVAELVLMAPALCFARRWGATFGEDRIAAWRDTGFLPVFHYGEGRMRNLSYRIMEDGRQYEDYPSFPQPCLLFHGTQDTVVPARLSEDFADNHPNIILRLLDSGHELTDVMESMWSETLGFFASRRAATEGAVRRISQ